MTEMGKPALSEEDINAEVRQNQVLYFDAWKIPHTKELVSVAFHDFDQVRSNQFKICCTDGRFNLNEIIEYFNTRI